MTIDKILELVESMAQALCVMIVRNWMEVAEIHMLYVAKSPERPFGKVNSLDTSFFSAIFCYTQINEAI